MKQTTLPPGTYGNVSGYEPDRLTEKNLGLLRTGKHACNPKEAVLLVQEIDRLRRQLAEPKVEEAK